MVENCRFTANAPFGSFRAVTNYLERYAVPDDSTADGKQGDDRAEPIQNISEAGGHGDNLPPILPE